MPLRILVADDNPAVLEMVRTLLVTEGFEVVGQATNGREAVELTRRLNPEVAVLDLAMPMVDGTQAALEIRDTCPETHVIMLSAFNTAALVTGAFRAGARGYVVKSDSIDDLIRAIGEVTRGGVFLSPSASRFVVEAYLPRDRR